MTEAPPTAAAAPSLPYRPALAATSLFYVASLAGGFVTPWIAAGTAVAFVAWAARRGVLRAPALVMAEVTWLVLGVVLKLAMLETTSAAPLAALLAILLVQYLAQLASDLRAFANTGVSAPPVTYAVTFAVAGGLAVATELFRSARADYGSSAGVALAMAIAAPAFLLLAIWWDWACRAFSSLKMAVTLLSLLAFGSVLGTAVIQHVPGETVAQHHEKFMNGEGAAPVNARYLFRDPPVEWTADDEARRAAMNAAFGAGQGDRWAELTRGERVRTAKQEEGRRWVAANEGALQAFYEFCERTSLTRIFKSWYYNALLVLLGATVVGVMVRRFPYERRDAGWVATHAGIVALLVCLAGSDLTVRDGFVSLAPSASPGEGELPTETASFEDLHDGMRPRMFRGWTLRLVRTSADWYQELGVALAGADGRTVAQRSYPVLAGRVIDLERPSADAPPRYRIEMLDVLDRSRTTRVGYRSGAGTGVAALQLLVEEDGKPRDRWITDEDAAALAIPGGRVRFVAASHAIEAEKWLAPRIAADTGDAGWLRVVAGGKDVARVPATVGASGEAQHGGATWKFTVTDVTLDVARMLQERSRPESERTPLARQVPAIGGVTLAASKDGAEPQRASAFSGEFADVANGQMANAVLRDAGFTFLLDFELPTELRVVARPDGSVVCVREDRGTVSEPRVLAKGDALPVEGAQLALGEVVRDAELDVHVEPIPAETDGEYLRNGLAGVNEQPGRPAVRVRVTEPGAAPYEQWIVGGDPWMKSPLVETRDRRLRMVLASTAESMFRSAVQAVDPRGNVLAEHVVRVNAPFRMRGYELYQNNFVRPDLRDERDRAGPSTTFRVKWDPFVPWIYGGFVVVALGVITMLWFPGQRAFKLNEHLARLPEDRP
jgi:hypothetical protein